MDFSSSNPNPKSTSAKQETYNSIPIKRNALIFGIVMLFLQIGFTLIYGFLINVPTHTLNTGSILVAIGLAILVIAGFGLLFGYTKQLIWSGIGFTFFITAFCIEVYPLVNDFWTKVGLQSNNTTPNFDFSNKSFNLYLSDRETGTGGNITFFGNSLTNAIKCALSVSIAFSALLGRAGHLECLIVSVFGVIGFELNRQIVQENQGTDTFGTFYIFTFGGFMGLALGLLSMLRERKAMNQLDRASMKKYTSSEYSAVYAAFGALIIFALFPLLSYEIDAYTRYNSHSPYTNPVCIIIGMGSGLVGAMFISLLINGTLILRDALHGPIAGAIVVGASSLYITIPTYAFVAGASGGIIQALIQNLVEKPAARKRMIVSTVSWTLFGFQGIVGAAFAAGWKAIYFTTPNGMTIQGSTLTLSSQFEFYAGLISAGIGATAGILAGLLVILVNNQQSREYFEDRYYWFNNDGIKYEGLVEKRPQPVKPPQTQTQPRPQPQPYEEKVDEVPVNVPVQQEPSEKSEEPLPENLSSEPDEFDFSEAYENVANPYAFL